MKKGEGIGAEALGPYKGVNKDLMHLFSKLEFIYNNGSEDEKDRIYGAISRVYNKITEEQDGGIKDDERSAREGPGGEDAGEQRRTA